MRAVHLADIEVAARALAVVAPPDRQNRLLELMKNAHLADKVRKKFGKSHPEFGNGTLMSAALKGPLAPRPDYITTDFAACLRLVLAQVGGKNR